MTILSNTILTCCGMFRYVKGIKPEKFAGQSLFKKQLKFQNLNEFFLLWHGQTRAQIIGRF